VCARVKTAFAAVSLAVAVGCGGGGSPTEEIPSCENRGDMYFAGGWGRPLPAPVA